MTDKKYPNYITMEELRDTLDQAARHVSISCDYMADDLEDDGMFWQLQPVRFEELFQAVLESFDDLKEREQKALVAAQERLARFAA